MTQEDKELLLKDLCARLPYGVNVDIKYQKENGSSLRLAVCSEGMLPLNTDLLGLFQEEEIYLKPYLRPMSSMTEEEKQTMDSLWKDNNKLVFADPDEVRRYKFYDISVVDFLNSRHFDYRGLIEKGLAFEAPDGMYNLNKE